MVAWLLALSQGVVRNARITRIYFWCPRLIDSPPLAPQGYVALRYWSGFLLRTVVAFRHAFCFWSLVAILRRLAG